MSIYLYSRPVHSGKTTTMLNWSAQQDDILGILMPDIEGSRKIMDLASKEVFDIECTDPANTNEQLTTVGKYSFYTSAFEKANFLLMNAIDRDSKWIVIDEAGKLELAGKGFFNAVAKAVKKYKDPSTPGNLLIVVRDSLVDEVIRFFEITNYTVIQDLKKCS